MHILNYSTQRTKFWSELRSTFFLCVCEKPRLGKSVHLHRLTKCTDSPKPWSLADAMHTEISCTRTLKFYTDSEMCYPLLNCLSVHNMGMLPSQHCSGLVRHCPLYPNSRRHSTQALSIISSSSTYNSHTKILIHDKLL